MNSSICEGLHLRQLYTLLLLLLLPFIWLSLLLPGSRRHGYGARWRERLGWFARRSSAQPCIWVHCASVGEVNAAQVFIHALQQTYPHYQLALTTSTPTGSQRVRELFGDAQWHVYLPLDLPFAVNGFLKRLRPALAIMLETEIWPNLYHALHRRRIPLLIANARLSRKSLRARMPLLRGLLDATLACVTHVCVQSRLDAARYRLLGMPRQRISMIGNFKYEQPVDTALVAQGRQLRDAIGRQRPVWIMASTHEGEEAAGLAAHSQLLQALPEALLILVPRHPERFAHVRETVQASGLRLASRSTQGMPDARTQCFVLDSMGELLPYYVASDVAFVGGSLVPVGGHNILEPALLGCCVVVGPHTANIAAICRRFELANALRRVADATALEATVSELLLDAAQRALMRQSAQQVIRAERGAVARTLGIVDKALHA